MAVLAVARGGMASASLLALVLGTTAGCDSGEARETVASSSALQEETAAPAGEGRVIAGGKPLSRSPVANPFEGDSAAAEEGGRLFVAFNCDGCHGGGAVGMIGPNLADGRWRYGGSPGVIFETIHGGRANGMPAFGGVLPEPSIWKIVTYLQSLQPAEDQPTITF